MIGLKVIAQGDGAIDFEDIQDNIDSDAESNVEYNSVPVKKRVLKEKLDQREFKDNEVISEKEFNEKKKKGGVRATPEESSSFEDENDKVLNTSFKLSPYAINLISMIKRNNSLIGNNLKILSRNKVLLDITSSVIDSFFEIMKSRYVSISVLNQLASEINASSGIVTLIQPKLIIDLGKNEEDEKVSALVMSSVVTKIKMLSEEFGVSDSCIVEYLIYMYVSNSDNPIFNNSKIYCEERMGVFIAQLDTFIVNSTHKNVEDENTIRRMGFKMLASQIIERTMTSNNFNDIRGSFNTNLGSDYNINAKFIVNESNKKTHDKTHSKGVFKQKQGRKSKKISNDEE